MKDMINHPEHYTQASVLLEPIDILRYAPFDLGNCLKYILRAGHKGDALEDWKKARKYLIWTEQSYQLNPKPYDDFILHYGLLLNKFSAFDTELPWVNEFYSWIERLTSIIFDHVEKGVNPIGIGKAV